MALSKIDGLQQGANNPMVTLADGTTQISLDDLINAIIDQINQNTSDIAGA
jgi:hypothetical protein